MCVVAGQQLLNPARDKARHRGDIRDGVTPREQPDHLKVPRRGRILGRQAVGGRTAHAVAAGEAEIGLASIGTFADLPQGVEFLGPLPSELQHYNVVAGAISASAREADAGKALLTFLTSPDAAPALKAKGLEPAVY